MRSRSLNSRQRCALTPRILHIPLYKIDPNPNQPRKYFGVRLLGMVEKIQEMVDRFG